MTNLRSRLAPVAALLSIALLMAGCSTGDDSAGPASTASSAADQAKLDALLKEVRAGTGSDLSTLTPVTPKPGTKLYVMSCGEAIPACAFAARDMKAAGEAAGWDSNIVDGKTNPAGFATAIRQATAAGANVIIPIAIGCGVAQAAFQEAVDAGVTIVGGDGGVDDCTPKLWKSEAKWLPDYSTQAQWELYGKWQAEYAYAKTGGNTKAIVLNLTSQPWGGWLTESVTSTLQGLGGTVSATVDLGDNETNDGSFVQKVTTAVLANPDANTLIVPVDAWMTGGLAAALVSAGLSDKLLVIARGSDESTLALIRTPNSGLNATVAQAVDWAAWGSVDMAVRLLAGKDPEYIGQWAQIVDSENVSASGPYVPEVDFKSLYKQSWGTK